MKIRVPCWVEGCGKEILGCFLLLDGEKRRLESTCTLEGGESGGRTGDSVMSILYNNSCLDQDAGVWAVRQRRPVSISWFIHSVWSLDCGWNPDDRMMVGLKLAQNSFQSLEVNWESCSEPMSIGILWRVRRCSVGPRWQSLWQMGVWGEVSQHACMV